MIKDIQDREPNCGRSDFALGDRPPVLLPRLPCPWTYQCQGDDHDQCVGLGVNYSRIVMLALMVLYCGIGSQLVEGCLDYSDWLQGR